MKDLTEAHKMDILLSFKGKGYNLQDTEDPATMKMELGTGYTLLASVDKSWFIEFNDGIETSKYHIESPKIPYTNAKDARKLCKEYTNECKRVLDEMKGEPVPEQKEPEPVNAEVVDLEEKKRILEALENGEIQKPESKPERTQKQAKREVQRIPARIPEDIRCKQIAKLTIDDIKSYLCPTATDQEAYMFLQLCQARNLNPFLNEAYLIKYGNKATMTVGKEAYMRRAEAHPQFDGFEAGIIIQHPDKTLERREGTFILKGETLVGGWAKVYRKDRKQPFISEVSLDEYNTKQSLWVSKPATMIRKVAIVQGKREAFPSEFSGMYDPAEVGVSDEDIIEATYQEVEA